MTDSKYTLTDSEYWAVYDYITSHMDEWPEELKKGFLKLINGEAQRQNPEANPPV